MMCLSEEMSSHRAPEPLEQSAGVVRVVLAVDLYTVYEYYSRRQSLHKQACFLTLFDLS